MKGFLAIMKHVVQKDRMELNAMDMLWPIIRDEILVSLSSEGTIHDCIVYEFGNVSLEVFADGFGDYMNYENVPRGSNTRRSGCEISFDVTAAILAS